MEAARKPLGSCRPAHNQFCASARVSAESYSALKWGPAPCVAIILEACGSAPPLHLCQRCLPAGGAGVSGGGERTSSTAPYNMHNSLYWRGIGCYGLDEFLVPGSASKALLGFCSTALGAVASLGRGGEGRWTHASAGPEFCLQDFRGNLQVPIVFKHASQMAAGLCRAWG